jgi:UDP-galactopyranose mutase
LIQQTTAQMKDFRGQLKNVERISDLIKMQERALNYMEAAKTNEKELGKDNLWPGYFTATEQRWQAVAERLGEAIHERIYQVRTKFERNYIGKIKI